MISFCRSLSQPTHVTGPLGTHSYSNVPVPLRSAVTLAPSHEKMPRQPPVVHMVALLALRPNVSPATHAALESCLSSATEPLGTGAGGGALQFMMRVVIWMGDAEIAHMENSVLYSMAVRFGCLPLACAHCS